MLTELKIQNYALIRDLDIRFKEGLNTITGETGTGKSIMLGALGLILGNRADTASLMDADRKCIVEGKFNIGAYNLKAFFESYDLDWEENSILRREISPAGKSRAFINDTPVTLNVLKDLGEKLIDIHSQHQTIKLTGAAFQISLLDAFAGHKSLLEDYARLYRKYRTAAKELGNLQEQSARARKDYDYITFQLSEIDAAQLQPAEQEQLEEELNVLSNAESIQQGLQMAMYALYEDEGSINNRFSEVRKQLGGIASFNQRLQQLYQRIENMLIENKDVYAEINDLNDSISVDNERIEEINARLQLINSLLAKHHYRSIADLLKYADELRQNVNLTENLSDTIASLQQEIATMEAELERMASTLSKNRSGQISALEENLVVLLRQVGIPEARIVIKLNVLDKLNETGKDQVDILFSANKGARPEPVSQVASGGELSRLMLCFKYILADSIFLPTIIFDEIDTGVSGEVAIKVGQIIRRLSAQHQVVCITHQPQVAAMGAHHYVVYKISGEDFTQTHIRELSKEERVNEIAAMIGGHKPSSVAIENARELLSIND